jgi:uncharacterized membrane protein YkvA (DUF1232 family)
MDRRAEDYCQQLKERIEEWAESGDGHDNEWTRILVYSPDLFRLLCQLSGDPDVPASEQPKVAAAIAYFLSPLDLMAEGVDGPKAYVDDIALAAYVLKGIIDVTDPEVVEAYWTGSTSVLAVIGQILEDAERMIGSRRWTKLRGLVEPRS